jgi:gluconate:H+ symporter, GntP family
MSNTLWYIGLSLLVSIVFIVFSSRYWKLHPFFALLFAALIFALLAGKSLPDTFATIQQGFGSLLQQIGLLVVLGSCLGIVLEKTGAMEVISHRVIHLFGVRNSIWAMTSIGLVVGIPVFCDSGFIILSRLIPSIATQAAVNPAQLSLALSSGLYTSHVLVPPTPGPLAAAANFNMGAHLSQLIFISFIAAIPVAIVSFYLSRKLGKSIIIEINNNESFIPTTTIAAWKAFVPLLMPIILIALSSLPSVFSISDQIDSILKIIGTPAIALLIGLLLTSLLITKTQKQELHTWISVALKDAGIILLITGAGGSFGAVIKASGIDLLLKETIVTTAGQGIVFLMIGFLLAAILKTAQGSSTSSIIISSSLLAPLAATSGFTSPAQLSVLIVAIGGGAMTVSHANDSYFWVVSQFSGIAPRDAFRSFTWLTLSQGITALLSAIILFQFI